MATKTITTHEHTCDLCGAQVDEDELFRLYVPDLKSRGAREIYHRADICPGCQNHPISDIRDYFYHLNT